MFKLKIILTGIFFVAFISFGYCQIGMSQEFADLFKEKIIPNLRNRTPEELNRLEAEARKILRTKEQEYFHRKAKQLLLKLGDKEIEEETFKNFRSENWKKMHEAYSVIIRASTPRLITKLETDLNLEEPTTDRSYGEEFSSSPLSVRSAMIIQSIILNSGEFPEPVVNWAKTLNQEPVYFRASAREFVKQNREQLKSGNFAATKPPTGVDKLTPTEPTASPTVAPKVK